jgi:hypothetical protein
MKTAATDQLDADAKSVLLISGGAALIVLGAGMVMAHPAVRQSAKLAWNTLMPDLEGPLKSGVRGVLPDVERYLKLKGM